MKMCLNMYTAVLQSTWMYKAKRTITSQNTQWYNGINYNYNQTDVVVTIPYLQNVLVYQTLLKVTLLKLILKFFCH